MDQCYTQRRYNKSEEKQIHHVYNVQDKEIRNGNTYSEHTLKYKYTKENKSQTKKRKKEALNIRINENTHNKRNAENYKESNLIFFDTSTQTSQNTFESLSDGETHVKQKKSKKTMLLKAENKLEEQNTNVNKRSVTCEKDSTYEQSSNYEEMQEANAHLEKRNMNLNMKLDSPEKQNINIEKMPNKYNTVSKIDERYLELMGQQQIINVNNTYQICVNNKYVNHYYAETNTQEEKDNTRQMKEEAYFYNTSPEEMPEINKSIYKIGTNNVHKRELIENNNLQKNSHNRNTGQTEQLPCEIIDFKKKGSKKRTAHLTTENVHDMQNIYVEERPNIYETFVNNITGEEICDIKNSDYNNTDGYKRKLQNNNLIENASAHRNTCETYESEQVEEAQVHQAKPKKRKSKNLVHNITGEEICGLNNHDGKIENNNNDYKTKAIKSNQFEKGFSKCDTNTTREEIDCKKKKSKTRSKKVSKTQKINCQNDSKNIEDALNYEQTEAPRKLRKEEKEALAENIDDQQNINIEMKSKNKKTKSQNDKINVDHMIYGEISANGKQVISENGNLPDIIGREQILDVKKTDKNLESSIYEPIQEGKTKSKKKKKKAFAYNVTGDEISDVTINVSTVENIIGDYESKQAKRSNSEENNFIHSNTNKTQSESDYEKIETKRKNSKHRKMQILTDNIDDEKNPNIDKKFKNEKMEIQNDSGNTETFEENSFTRRNKRQTYLEKSEQLPCEIMDIKRRKSKNRTMQLLTEDVDDVQNVNIEKKSKIHETFDCNITGTKICGIKKIDCTNENNNDDGYKRKSNDLRENISILQNTDETSEFEHFEEEQVYKAKSKKRKSKSLICNVNGEEICDLNNHDCTIENDINDYKTKQKRYNSEEDGISLRDTKKTRNGKHEKIDLKKKKTKTTTGLLTYDKDDLLNVNTDKASEWQKIKCQKENRNLEHVLNDNLRNTGQTYESEQFEETQVHKAKSKKRKSKNVVPSVTGQEICGLNNCDGKIENNNNDYKPKHTKGNKFEVEGFSKCDTSTTREETREKIDLNKNKSKTIECQNDDKNIEDALNYEQTDGPRKSRKQEKETLTEKIDDLNTNIEMKSKNKKTKSQTDKIKVDHMIYGEISASGKQLIQREKGSLPNIMGREQILDIKNTDKNIESSIYEPIQEGKVKSKKKKKKALGYNVTGDKISDLSINVSTIENIIGDYESKQAKNSNSEENSFTHSRPNKTRKEKSTDNLDGGQNLNIDKKSKNDKMEIQAKSSNSEENNFTHSNANKTQSESDYEKIETKRKNSKHRKMQILTDNIDDEKNPNIDKKSKNEKMEIQNDSGNTETFEENSFTHRNRGQTYLEKSEQLPCEIMDIKRRKSKNRTMQLLTENVDDMQNVNIEKKSKIHETFDCNITGTKICGIKKIDCTNENNNDDGYKRKSNDLRENISILQNTDETYESEHFEQAQVYKAKSKKRKSKSLICNVNGEEICDLNNHDCTIENDIYDYKTKQKRYNSEEDGVSQRDTKKTHNGKHEKIDLKKKKTKTTTGLLTYDKDDLHNVNTDKASEWQKIKCQKENRNLENVLNDNASATRKPHKKEKEVLTEQIGDMQDIIIAIKSENQETESQADRRSAKNVICANLEIAATTKQSAQTKNETLSNKMAREQIFDVTNTNLESLSNYDLTPKKKVKTKKKKRESFAYNANEDTILNLSIHDSKTENNFVDYESKPQKSSNSEENIDIRKKISKNRKGQILTNIDDEQNLNINKKSKNEKIEIQNDNRNIMEIFEEDSLSPRNTCKNFTETDICDIKKSDYRNENNNNDSYKRKLSEISSLEENICILGNTGESHVSEQFEQAQVHKGKRNKRKSKTIFYNVTGEEMCGLNNYENNFNDCQTKPIKRNKSEEEDLAQCDTNTTHEGKSEKIDLKKKKSKLRTTKLLTDNEDDLHNANIGKTSKSQKVKCQKDTINLEDVLNDEAPASRKTNKEERGVFIDKIPASRKQKKEERENQKTESVTDTRNVEHIIYEEKMEIQNDNRNIESLSQRNTRNNFTGADICDYRNKNHNKDGFKRKFQESNNLDENFSIGNMGETHVSEQFEQAQVHKAKRKERKSKTIFYNATGEELCGLNNHDFKMENNYNDNKAKHMKGNNSEEDFTQCDTNTTIERKCEKIDLKNKKSELRTTKLLTDNKDDLHNSEKASKSQKDNIKLEDVLNDEVSASRKPKKEDREVFIQKIGHVQDINIDLKSVNQKRESLTDTGNVEHIIYEETAANRKHQAQRKTQTLSNMTREQIVDLNITNINSVSSSHYERKQEKKVKTKKKKNKSFAYNVIGDEMVDLSNHDSKTKNNISDYESKPKKSSNSEETNFVYCNTNKTLNENFEQSYCEKIDTRKKVSKNRKNQILSDNIDDEQNLNMDKSKNEEMEIQKDSRNEKNEENSFCQRNTRELYLKISEQLPCGITDFEKETSRNRTVQLLKETVDDVQHVKKDEKLKIHEPFVYNLTRAEIYDTKQGDYRSENNKNGDYKRNTSEIHEYEQFTQAPVHLAKSKKRKPKSIICNVTEEEICDFKNVDCNIENNINTTREGKHEKIKLKKKSKTRLMSQLTDRTDDLHNVNTEEAPKSLKTECQNDKRNSGDVLNYEETSAMRKSQKEKQGLTEEIDDEKNINIEMKWKKRKTISQADARNVEYTIYEEIPANIKQPIQRENKNVSINITREQLLDRNTDTNVDSLSNYELQEGKVKTKRIKEKTFSYNITEDKISYLDNQDSKIENNDNDEEYGSKSTKSNIFEESNFAHCDTSETQQTSEQSHHEKIDTKKKVSKNRIQKFLTVTIDNGQNVIIDETFKNEKVNIQNDKETVENVQNINMETKSFDFSQKMKGPNNKINVLTYQGTLAERKPKVTERETSPNCMIENNTCNAQEQIPEQLYCENVSLKKKKSKKNSLQCSTDIDNAKTIENKSKVVEIKSQNERNLENVLVFENTTVKREQVPRRKKETFKALDIGSTCHSSVAVPINYEQTQEEKVKTKRNKVKSFVCNATEEKICDINNYDYKMENDRFKKKSNSFTDRCTNATHQKDSKKLPYCENTHLKQTNTKQRVLQLLTDNVDDAQTVNIENIPEIQKTKSRNDKNNFEYVLLNEEPPTKRKCPKETNNYNDITDINSGLVSNEQAQEGKVKIKRKEEKTRDYNLNGEEKIRDLNNKNNAYERKVIKSNTFETDNFTHYNTANTHVEKFEPHCEKKNVKEKIKDRSKQLLTHTIDDTQNINIEKISETQKIKSSNDKRNLENITYEETIEKSKLKKRKYKSVENVSNYEKPQKNRKRIKQENVVSPKCISQEKILDASNTGQISIDNKYVTYSNDVTDTCSNSKANLQIEKISRIQDMENQNENLESVAIYKENLTNKKKTKENEILFNYITQGQIEYSTCQNYINNQKKKKALNYTETKNECNENNNNSCRRQQKSNNASDMHIQKIENPNDKKKVEENLDNQEWKRKSIKGIENVPKNAHTNLHIYDEELRNKLPEKENKTYSRGGEQIIDANSTCQMHDSKAVYKANSNVAIKEHSFDKVNQMINCKQKRPGKNKSLKREKKTLLLNEGSGNRLCSKPKTQVSGPRLKAKKQKGGKQYIKGNKHMSFEESLLNTDDEYFDYLKLKKIDEILEIMYSQSKIGQIKSNESIQDTEISKSSEIKPLLPINILSVPPQMIANKRNCNEEKAEQKERELAVLYFGKKTLPKVKANCLKGLNFIRTGMSYSLQNEEFENIVKDVGGIISNEISRKIDYIVIDDDGDTKHNHNILSPNEIIDEKLLRKIKLSMIRKHLKSLSKRSPRNNDYIYFQNIKLKSFKQNFHERCTQRGKCLDLESDLLKTMLITDWLSLKDVIGKKISLTNNMSLKEMQDIYGSFYNGVAEDMNYFSTGKTISSRVSKKAKRI